MKNILLIFFFWELFVLNSFSSDYKKVEYNANYKIEIKGNTRKVQLVCLIPKDIKNIQRIRSIKYSRPPFKVYNQNGNKYAEFLINSEKGVIKIDITAQLEIFTHDLNSVKKGKIVTLDSPNKYLRSEKYIEKDDRRIKSLGFSMLNKDTLKTVKQIYDYVNRHMVYDGYNPDQIGALKALKQLRGDCTDFTDLFVALCRSCNIPSIAIEGHVLNYSGTPKHSWAEVYCGRYGWIRFDPTPGNLNVFDKLANQYIQISMRRNEDFLNGFHYYGYKYWGDPVMIVEDINLKNETRPNTIQSTSTFGRY